MPGSSTSPLKQFPLKRKEKKSWHSILLFESRCKTRWCILGVKKHFHTSWSAKRYKFLANSSEGNLTIPGMLRNCMPEFGGWCWLWIVDLGLQRESFPAWHPAVRCWAQREGTAASVWALNTAQGIYRRRVAWKHPGLHPSALNSCTIEPLNTIKLYSSPALYSPHEAAIHAITLTHLLRLLFSLLLSLASHFLLGSKRSSSLIWMQNCLPACSRFLKGRITIFILTDCKLPCFDYLQHSKFSYTQ